MIGVGMLAGMVVVGKITQKREKKATEEASKPISSQDKEEKETNGNDQDNSKQ